MLAPNANSPPSVAFLGLGVMGRSMAGHLLDAGHRLVLHSRRKESAEALLARGGACTWADTPRDAASGVDVVISMVGFPHDVEAVHLGVGDGGTLAASPAPRLLIDMTTSRPSLAARIASEAGRRGIMALDAPVSGGDVGARNASLSIMVGGDAAAFEQALPILERLGTTIVHQGGPGAGQHTKMVNQILIAGTMMGLCEGLHYAKASGLDPSRVLESVGGGAAGSWSIANLAPRILRGDFEPGFFIDHFVKDLGIAIEEAARLGVTLPALGLAKSLYERAQAQGLGRKGTQALALVPSAE